MKEHNCFSKICKPYSITNKSQQWQKWEVTIYLEYNLIKREAIRIAIIARRPKEWANFHSDRLVQLIGSKYGVPLILVILYLLPATIAASVASLHPSSSCATTILLPNPCPLFLLRMHVTPGEVVTSVKCRHAIGWKLADVTGVSLYMRLDAIPPWTPCYLDRADPFSPLSSRSAHAEGGAIGIEKWCTPVQSHSFPRLSDLRGRRAPLSSSLRRSPILFRDSPLLFFLLR